MNLISSVKELPNAAAVYAMYGGRGRSAYVAYVGMADALKRRLVQHLVRRDSSIVTGVTAVGLNPEYVSEIRWWEHPDFSQRGVLEAAELVAFDVLDPALRSRGAITERARELYADVIFNEQMRAIFEGTPTGILVIHNLQHALERIGELERRVKILEQRLQEQ